MVMQSTGCLIMHSGMSVSPHASHPFSRVNEVGIWLLYWRLSFCPKLLEKFQIKITVSQFSTSKPYVRTSVNMREKSIWPHTEFSHSQLIGGRQRLESSSIFEEAFQSIKYISWQAFHHFFPCFNLIGLLPAASMNQAPSATSEIF